MFKAHQTLCWPTNQPTDYQLNSTKCATNSNQPDQSQPNNSTRTQLEPTRTNQRQPIFVNQPTGTNQPTNRFMLPNQPFLYTKPLPTNQPTNWTNQPWPTATNQPTIPTNQPGQAATQLQPTWPTRCNQTLHQVRALDWFRNRKRGRPWPSFYSEPTKCSVVRNSGRKCSQSEHQTFCLHYRVNCVLHVLML